LVEADSLIIEIIAKGETNYVEALMEKGHTKITNQAFEKEN